MWAASNYVVDENKGFLIDLFPFKIDQNIFF